MLEATFLGHQSWLLGADGTHVLVDPILRDGMGERPDPVFEAYPPRALALDAMPPLRGVLISHEHPDHLDVASLALLDRRIPVYLSARSSVAARTILAEMGFTVGLLEPDRPVTLGALTVVPFRAYGYTQPHEWDVVPMLIRHDRTGDDFFTAVDLSETPEMIADVRRHSPRVGIWTWALNDMDVSDLWWGAQADLEGPKRKVRDWESAFDRAFGRWAPPATLLTYGGGFSLPGELGWLNRRFFHIDLPTVSQALDGRGGTRVVAPAPGEVFAVEAGRSIARPACGFVAVPPRASWPPHDAAERGGPVPDLGPHSGRRALSDDERRELLQRLEEIAAMLYDGAELRALYTLDAARLGGRRPAIALKLRDDARPLTLVHDPTRCAFVVTDDERPEDTHVAGASCWASDLLDTLRVTISPGYLGVGRLAQWNAAPSALRFSFDMLLYLYAHPLRQPARFLELYRSAWARSRDVEVRVPAAQV